MRNDLPSTALALNHAEAATASVAMAPALCVELLPDGQVPEWVPLIPSGAEVRTRDGRGWKNPDPAAVIAATREYGLPLPMDFEHATELAAPRGQIAPAAGWIEELEVRAGAIMARMSWTPKGAEMIRNREYRFISPVFFFDKDTLRIIRITSAALTNRPAMPELALNSFQQKGPAMTPEQRKALCVSLGLPEAATDADIVVAAAKQKDDLAKALNAAKTPDLNLFVPRADLEAQIAKTQTAEKALNERTQAEHKAKATAAVENAVKEGKVAPASKDFYLATCATAEGLVKFEEFIKSAPTIAPATELGKTQPGGGAPNAAGLNADQLAVCARLNIPPEEYAKALA